MDYFVWGYLKGRLHKGLAFPSLEVLMERIKVEARGIPLDNFWEQLLICEERADLNVEMED